MAWINRIKLRWNDVLCKRCWICVDVCPANALALVKNEIVEEPGRCKQIGMCERYCPDIAIELIDRFKVRGPGERQE